MNIVIQICFYILTCAFAFGATCNEIDRVPTGQIDVQIILVKGSQWDTPTAQSYVQTEVEQAGKIIGLNVRAKFIWRSDEDLVSYFSCNPSQLIGLFNKYGLANTPTLIFSGSKIPYWKQVIDAIGNPIGCVATTVAKPWYGTAVVNEGIAFVLDTQHVNARVIAHEFGHLLGGLTGKYNHSYSFNELMSAYGSGCSISEPWYSAITQSHYIKR